MEIHSKYVDNNNTYIHYLECGCISENIPSLLYVPGLLGTAEQFSDEFKEFSPRHCISISLRGRGNSSTPENGYSFEEHCSDIISVIEHTHLKQFYLVCHSAGVPFSLEIALKYKEKIKGLVLCDYPPHIPSFSPNWLSNVLSSSTYTAPFLTTLVNELKPINLSDKLNQINAPVLVLQEKNRR